jgi:hypothetical protein
VDPRAGLDDVEKRKFLTLPQLKLLPLGRPARSESLYRLRYPGSRGGWMGPGTGLDDLEMIKILPPPGFKL